MAVGEARNAATETLPHNGTAEVGDADGGLFRPSEEELRAPYLRGLPQLSDQMARRAGARDITAVEQRLITREIRRICRIIREARQEWEAEQAEEADWPPVP